MKFNIKFLQKWIKYNLFDKDGKLKKHNKTIIKKNENLYNYIFYKTSFLDSKYNATISQRLWHIFYNAFELQKCPNCSSILPFKTFDLGYAKYCSQKCYINNPDKAVIKSRQTKKNNYGNENFNNSKKAKLTKLKRYGDENFNNFEKKFEDFFGFDPKTKEKTN